jgi:seryl-tRNA(Sec) selenium transferase
VRIPRSVTHHPIPRAARRPLLLLLLTATHAAAGRLAGRGSYTAMSGSLTLPEVKAAMAAAGEGYVDIRELQLAVGERIGAVMGTEYGVVTNGCAAALAHITAACLAGTDPELQARLPFTAGMPNEVIVQQCHRFGYDYAITASGGKLVEVETLEEMKAAISDKTVMMMFLGDALDNHPGETKVPMATMAALAQEHGITMVVDAAAERPDVPNEYLEQGADVVCYSGGKVLRGPQSGGLMIGKRDILDAAQKNQAPNGGIGRPMKVGKEEYMGMLAAVELWVQRDHVKEW